MQIIKNITSAKKITKGGTVTIGNFDGVHLGHQELINKAREISESSSLGIITFEPHPREYFGKVEKHFKLMSNERKYSIIKDFGVHFVVELRFDETLENFSPNDFIFQILHQKLGIRNVIVGEDFRFGKNRSGSFQVLKKVGKQLGINAVSFRLETLESKGTRISSTSIRSALKEGNTGLAKEMLGGWHKIYGTVVKGVQRGREMGFPTINLNLKGILIPKFGVYACFIEILSGEKIGKYQGVASIGKRPMFGENRANLEVNIFDFSSDIYESEVAISLVQFQRPEEKYNTVYELKTQMAVDCQIAKKILSTTQTDR